MRRSIYRFTLLILGLLACILPAYGQSVKSSEKAAAKAQEAFPTSDLIHTTGSQAGCGAILDQTFTRVQTSLVVDLERIGTLKPKSVDEIETSMWSLGCETLDRNLANWDAYRDYLKPLGIKCIRLQGGWGRSEKVKGVYDFAWLDHIVDDAHSLGLEVCIETSYGNKLYDKKAPLGPSTCPLPHGDEVLAGWDNWVEAMVKHYKPKGVRLWSMYNEPNLGLGSGKGNSPETTADFNVRTAEIIKRIDPDAKIAGLVISGVSTKLIDGYLKRLQELGKLDLFHWVVFHGYSGNPDSTKHAMKKMWEITQRYSPTMKLWQGEAGCASEEVQYALKGIPWTELSHSKWNSRRMLSDIGHDVKSAVFTISDLSYHKNFISRYGLLKTAPDNSIIKVKTAYYVVQNIVSVFNDTLQRVPDYEMKVDSPLKFYQWYAFRDKATGLDVVTFWDGTTVPKNTNETTKATLTITGGKFNEPVWVDMITGNIYAIPKERVIIDGDTCTFKDIPVYDAPTVITDKSLLSFVPARKKK